MWIKAGAVLQFNFKARAICQWDISILALKRPTALPRATVYKNGSWADLKPGVHVLVSGHSTEAETVAFGGGTGVAQSAQGATAINQRGLIKQAKGDWDGAMADYNQAIKLDPKYSAAYDNRGYDKRQKGDLSGALADIN
jgi:tetratricopeptide (TPR) repeat protein